MPDAVRPAHHRDGIAPLLCDIELAVKSGDNWQSVAERGGATVNEGRILVELDANLLRNVFDGSRRLREPGRFSAECMKTAAARFPAATIVQTGTDTRFRAWLVPQQMTAFHAVIAGFQPETVMQAWHPDRTTFGSIASEGPGVMGTAGYPAPIPTGNSVKVAVIDNGFAGASSTAAAEVGAYTSPQANVASGTEDHGTACAEIIRDAAPDAQLRLYALPLGMTYSQAVNDAISWGAQVISVSLGGHGYPGEGDGCDAARLAKQNNILWCNSAGNSGYREYWERQNPVIAASGLAEMAPGVTLSQITPYSGATRVWVSFTNEQPNAGYARFQAVIFADSGSGPVEVAQGTAGSTAQSVMFSSMQAGTTYYVGIRRTQAGTVGRMRFFLYDGGTLSHYSNVGSIANPATLDNEVITVGAVNYTNYSAAGTPTYYSSRGGGLWNLPLDFCAPTQCSTLTYGPSGFNGTSCSCPNAAALLGLQLSHPSFQSNPLGTLALVNLGPAGWDVDSGWGIIRAPVQAGGGSTVPLFQGTPVSASNSPSTLLITPQAFYWNAVGVSSTPASNWNLQMGTTTANGAAGLCDFLVADGNQGTISGTGTATRATGSGTATAEHAALTSLQPGYSAGFNFTGGHVVHVWEVLIQATGTYPVTVSGSANPNFSWYVYAPATNSVWRTKAQATFGPFGVGATPQQINFSAAGYWAIVAALDNGTPSTDTITVSISNPLAVPSIAVTASSLALGAISQGVAGVGQSYSVSGSNLTDDISIQSPLSVELSRTGQAGSWTPFLVLARTGGTVPPTTIYARIAASAPPGPISGNVMHTSAGATTRNVSVGGQVNPPATPTIVASQANVNLGSTTSGSAGATASYSVSGTALQADIVITAPAGAEVSLVAAAGFGPFVNLAPVSGTVAPRVVFVRIAATAAVGAVAGNISHASSGASSVNVGVAGTVVAVGTALIAISRTSLDLGGTSVNLTSGSPYHYFVEGTGLVSDIVITAPQYVRVALDGDQWSASVIVQRAGSTIAPTRIHVMMTVGTTGYTGPVVGDIAHASTGAVTRNLALNGVVLANTAPSVFLLPLGGRSPLVCPTLAFGSLAAPTTFDLYKQNVPAGVSVKAPPGFEMRWHTNSDQYFNEMTVTTPALSPSIYIRMAADAAPGFYSGEIIATGAGAPIGRLFVEGTISPPSGPTIAVSHASIPLEETSVGVTGIGVSYRMSARNLTGDVTVTAPADVELSKTGAIGSYAPSMSFTPTNGEISSAPIFARIAATAITAGGVDRTISGSLTHSGGGALAVLRPCSGILNWEAAAALILSSPSVQLPLAQAGQPSAYVTITVNTTPYIQSGILEIVAPPEVELGSGVSPSTFSDLIFVGTTPLVLSIRTRATTPEGAVSCTLRIKRAYCQDAFVSVTGSVLPATTPTVFVEPAGLSHQISSAEGSPSQPLVYAVRGYALLADLVIAPPAGMEVSADGMAYSPTVALQPIAGGVPQTSVYVRLAASAAPGLVSGTIQNSSAGAPAQNIPVSGRVYASPGPAIFCSVTHVGLAPTEVGMNSPAATIVVSASGVSGGLSVGGTDPDVEVSIDGLSWGNSTGTASPVAGVIPPTTIYVRFQASLLGYRALGFLSIAMPGNPVPGLSIPCAGTGEPQRSVQIVLNSPVGGETWGAGTTQVVAWTVLNSSSSFISIELSADSGLTWTHVLASGHMPSSFAWQIPPDIPQLTTYRLRARLFPTPCAGATAFDFTIGPPPSPVILISQPTLDLGTTAQGTAGAAQVFNVSGEDLGTIPITITPPAGVEIRDVTAAGNFAPQAILLLPVAGTVATTAIEARIGAGAVANQSFGSITLTSGTALVNLTLSGTVTGPPPSLSVNPTSLNLGSVPQGSPGATFVYSVSGGGLSAPVTVTPPAGVELREQSSGAFSAAPINLPAPGGTLASTNIEVRISASATLAQTFMPVVHSSGATSTNLTLTGTVTAVPLPPANDGGGSDDGGCAVAGGAPALGFGLLVILLLSRRRTCRPSQRPCNATARA